MKMTPYICFCFRFIGGIAIFVIFSLLSSVFIIALPYFLGSSNHSQQTSFLFLRHQDGILP
jgi:hypothetical protein